MRQSSLTLQATRQGNEVRQAVATESVCRDAELARPEPTDRERDDHRVTLKAGTKRSHDRGLRLELRQDLAARGFLNGRKLRGYPDCYCYFCYLCYRRSRRSSVREADFLDCCSCYNTS
jgi:hypothetical protein